MDAFLTDLLDLMNETLAAAIVIIALSLLLYNITRNMRDRVARASGIVLACVTWTYAGDVFLTLGPGSSIYEAILRLQWGGIALIPAAMFHLSDALLATTGLPSRGRRHAVSRIMYVIGALFALLVAFTDLVIQPAETVTEFVVMEAAPLFLVYLAFFVVGTGAAFINVNRARLRCLTRSTRRRMAYLQLAMLTPPLGIFPYGLLLPPGEVFNLGALLVVNLANIVVVLMLLFLAYPLSFFGSRIPDRVVKVELLRFILRGPATGVLALVIILFSTSGRRFFSIPADQFMPFAVVTAVLFWQWMVALSLPQLERWLIYGQESAEQFSKLQDLSERLLTHTDLLQLMEANLESCCDYLRVNSAFVAMYNDNRELENLASVGPERPADQWLQRHGTSLETSEAPQQWEPYWVVPLYSDRQTSPTNGTTPVLGFMGIRARATAFNLTEEEQQKFIRTYVRRAAQLLDDLRLQEEIFAALEGLLPQIDFTRTRAAEVEFRPGYTTTTAVNAASPVDEQFVEQVRAALKHYWGGPGLSSSRLQELEIVHASLATNDNNPSRALRAVLLKAINSQKPPGEPRLTSPEWMIYNILNLRFIERLKVRDAAIRLALSEPDLYRKQRTAIEIVAETIRNMEQEARRDQLHT